MQKTTVYLDEQSYRQLKAIARRRQRPSAEMVREAVAEYASRHGRRSKARSIGAFKSGRRDLARRANALLDGIGEDR